MLENGLEAIIVSDPKTDKAAAAMDVKVGHLSDPEDIPGLAHFCEHLMFMGTEKVRSSFPSRLHVPSSEREEDADADEARPPARSTPPRTTTPSS